MSALTSSVVERNHDMKWADGIIRLCALSYLPKMNQGSINKVQKCSKRGFRQAVCHISKPRVSLMHTL